jgi:triosephosphate isomerase
MNKKYFYIANWKMQWTLDETLNFATKNYDTLVDCTHATSATIILCPSYPALYPLSKIFKTTNISIGAQNCSAHLQGAFTGQVSATHLKSVDCSYCIIGHSECDTLVQVGITPILCIGETEEQKKEGSTLNILGEQLTPVLNLLNEQKARTENTPILLAYEPVWAIGSDRTPSLQHLEMVYAWLTTITQQQAPFISWHFLYGGSVSARTITSFTPLTCLDGFLVGGASRDFQEFEKIVKYEK